MTAIAELRRVAEIQMTREEKLTAAEKAVEMAGDFCRRRYENRQCMQISKTAKGQFCRWQQSATAVNLQVRKNLLKFVQATPRHTATRQE